MTPRDPSWRDYLDPHGDPPAPSRPSPTRASYAFGERWPGLFLVLAIIAVVVAIWVRSGGRL